MDNNPMIFQFLNIHLYPCGGSRHMLELANALIDLEHDVILSPPAKWDWIDVRARTSDKKQKDCDAFVVAVDQYTSHKPNVMLMMGLYYNRPLIEENLRRKWFGVVANSEFYAKIARSRGQQAIAAHPGVDSTKFTPPTKQGVMIGINTRGASLKEPDFIKNLRTKLPEMVETRGQHIGSTLIEAYRSSFIWLEPQLKKGNVSLSALEAMACGAIPIVSKVPGNDEVLTHGEDSLFAEPTEEAYMDAINMIRKDSTLNKKLRDGAIATAASYTWKRCAENFLKLWENDNGTQTNAP